MLCFNHVNKDGNLLDFNLTFRNNELVWISYDQKETKDALYELLSGTEVFEGKVIINGYSVDSFKQKQWQAYRKLFVGTTKIVNEEDQVLTILGYEMAFSHIGKQNIIKRIKNTIYQFKEAIDLHQSFKNLSPYQQWLVRLCKAFVKDPNIILIEDDFSDLTPHEKKNLLEILQEIADERLIILFSNKEDYTTFVDRHIILEKGRVIKDSCPLNVVEGSKGALTLPNANLSCVLIAECIKRYYRQHFIQGILLVLLVFVSLKSPLSMFLSALIACLIILAYHKEIRILKYSGATINELILIVFLHVLCPLVIACGLYLVLGKLDVIHALLCIGISIICSVISVKFKLR